MRRAVLVIGVLGVAAAAAPAAAADPWIPPRGTSAPLIATGKSTTNDHRGGAYNDHRENPQASFYVTVPVDVTRLPASVTAVAVSCGIMVPTPAWHAEGGGRTEMPVDHGGAHGTLVVSILTRQYAPIALVNDWFCDLHLKVNGQWFLAIDAPEVLDATKPLVHHTQGFFRR
jgi:hypothetical protein